MYYTKTNQKAEVKFFPSSHKANRHSQEDEGAFIIMNNAKLTECYHIKNAPSLKISNSNSNSNSNSGFQFIW